MFLLSVQYTGEHAISAHWCMGSPCLESSDKMTDSTPWRFFSEHSLRNAESTLITSCKPNRPLWTLQRTRLTYWRLQTPSKLHVLSRNWLPIQVLWGGLVQVVAVPLQAEIPRGQIWSLNGWWSIWEPWPSHRFLHQRLHTYMPCRALSRLVCRLWYTASCQ